MSLVVCNCNILVCKFVQSACTLFKMVVVVLSPLLNKFRNER